MKWIFALFLLFILARGTFAAYVNLAAPGFFDHFWHPIEGTVDFRK